MRCHICSTNVDPDRGILTMKIGLSEELPTPVRCLKNGRSNSDMLSSIRCSMADHGDERSAV
jgi:hypothetical protein